MANQIKKAGGLGRRMASAFVVALGVAVAWGVVGGWVGSTISSWVSPPLYFVSESFAVMRDGTPVIESHAPDDYQDVSYRKLNGEEIQLPEGKSLGSQFLGPASLANAIRPPRFFAVPLVWGQTLSATTFGRPRSDWFLLRDTATEGRGYFIGYDAVSKKPIGFIGRAGFRHGVPAQDEWFDLGVGTGYEMPATSRQRLAVNSPAWQNSVDDYFNLPAWFVYVMDGDRLQEVDLRERTVRQVLEIPGLCSIGILGEERPEAPTDADTPYEKWAVSRLVARADDRLIMVDLQGSENRVFPLPESLRERSLSVYSLRSGELLLNWDTWNPREAGEMNPHHMAVLNQEGKIQHEEAFRLAADDHRQNPSPAFSLVMGMITPIPLGWGSTMFGIGPVFMANEHAEPTIAAALSWILERFWPGLVLVLAIGCLSAWLTYRWQRQYFRPHTGAWCTFAFLLGLPGVVAYWLEMSRGNLEACDECHTTVPRDRQACAACERPFAAAPLVGTEIFV